MQYTSISIDRREAYYARCAPLIASDPLAFYTRAENGRRVQGSIKASDLQPFHALDHEAEFVRKRGLTLAWSNDTRTRAA
ncbi:MAG: hypothetical protein ABI588_06355 [Arenimonas sp.]